MANVINLSILNNMPDGTYKTTVSNLTDGEIIHNDDVTFVGGVSQLPATTSALNDLITGIAVSNERPPLNFAPLLGSVVDDGVTPEPSNVVHLFLSIGNSHTVGRDQAEVGDTFDAKVLQYGGTTDTINHPTTAQLDHNDTNQNINTMYSPDLSFSNEYLSENPNIESMVFVPYGQGGSGFSTLWDPDSITGTRLQTAVARYLTAKSILEADGKTVIDSGVIWHNGIDPDFTGLSISEHAEKIDEFVTYIRSNLGATIPIVFGGGPMDAQLIARDNYTDGRKVANFTGAGHRYPYVAAYDNTNPQYNTNTVKPFQIFDSTHCTRESDIQKGIERFYGISRAALNSDPRAPFVSSDYDMLFDFRTGTYLDWSGNGNDLILNAASNPFIRYDSDIEQLVLDAPFPANSARMQLTSVIPQSYTINWFYKETNGTSCGFIYNNDDGVSDQVKFGALLSGTQIIAGHNGSSTDVQFDASILTSGFNLITLSYDSTSQIMTLYANGVEQDQATGILNHGGATQYLGTQKSDGTNSMEGKLSYCSISDYAMTSTQVAAENEKAQSLLV